MDNVEVQRLVDERIKQIFEEHLYDLVGQCVQQLLATGLQVSLDESTLRSIVEERIQTMLSLTVGEQQPNTNALITILRDMDVIRLNIKNFGYDIAQKFQTELSSKNEGELSRAKVALKSKLSTQEDIESKWVAYWCSLLKIKPIYHRKVWELCYVPQAIYENCNIDSPLSGIGFGCGEEPLASLFASFGHKITVTDLEPEKSQGLGWVETGQHTDSLDKAYFENIIEKSLFDKHVHLKYVDMNDIPSELNETYDYCWSVCAMEHLGSIKKGMEFVKNSLKVLKPNGVAVHTTEFNYTNAPTTIDNWPTVIFQRRHFELLCNELRKDGYYVAEFDFHAGKNVLDRFIDIPPYSLNIWGDINQAAHLKLSVDGFPCTCIGIIIKKPSQ